MVAYSARAGKSVRLLSIEFVGWHRESQKALLAVAGGVAAFCALLYALNLA